MAGDEAPYGLTTGSDDERCRLGLLEHVWDPFTTARLAAIGVGSGFRCLELGGGGGSIARWLCRQVGASRHVTATDLDTRLLEEINEPNLTVTRHDLLTDAFPKGSFDVIHARAVFEHIAARDTALPNVCEWLAPGGYLVIEDVAFFTAVASSSTTYAAAFQAIWDLLARAGTDYGRARTFPGPVVRCGLKDVGVDVSLDVLRGKSAVAEFWSLGLEALRPRLIESGLLSADAIDEARVLLADPDFWDPSPAAFCAWERRAG